MGALSSMGIDSCSTYQLEASFLEVLQTIVAVSTIQVSGLRICKMVRQNSCREPISWKGGATNMQLPRVVTVVLKGYAAMLGCDLCVE
jgi:hypothetical protein